jgi:type IX secretion system PorP/SprF family membrane protein
MTIMKKYIISGIFSLLSVMTICLSVKGQDPNPSQFFNTPIYFNPAVTGMNTGLRAKFTFRDQWANLPVDFRSYFFSADLGDRNLPGSGGLGLIVNSDNEGLAFIKNLTVGLTVGVRVPLSNSLVSQIGIKAAFIQKSLNWDDFVFTDQFSEKYGNIYTSGFQHPEITSKTIPDFGIGGLLQYSNESSSVNGVVGFGIDHLFQPDESFLAADKCPLPRKYALHSDFIITTGTGYNTNYNTSVRGAADPLKLNPGLLYQMQNGFSAYQFGMNLLKFNVYLGAWYKNSMKPNAAKSLSLLAGYRYFFGEDMSIKFMYTYDMQMAGPLQSAGGSHEVSVILEFGKLQVFGRGGGYTPRTSYKKYSPIECSSF